jgi:hypothetical protein
MQNPQMHDLREVYRRVYTAMEVDNLDKILPPPAQAILGSPLEDLIAASQGKPIKAFPGQDHRAHIMAKTAFLQDPMAGASPMFQAVAPMIQANIREHMLMQYAAAAMAAGQPGEVGEAQAIQQLAQAHLAELQMRAKEHEDKMLNNAAQLAIRNRELNLREQAQDQKGYVEGLKVKQKEADSVRKSATAAVAAIGRKTGAV